ncbi:MAG: VWA domain-containing protein [Phycisphaeraceae bacterium]|nr:VWA domain-containing protein [Phycisphaeraceae bacterium]
MRIPRPPDEDAPVVSGAIDTGVVLDNSGSMDDDDYHPTRWLAAVAATERFLQQKATHSPADRVAVIGYGSHARIYIPLISVSDAHKILYASVPRSSELGATNIASGLLAGAKQISKADRTAQPRRPLWSRISDWLYDEAAVETPETERQRKLLVLSDGHNNQKKPVPIAQRLKADGIEIDTVGIARSPEDVDEALLKRIASLDANGNPRYRFIADTKALVEEFKRLAGHIRAI